MTTTFTTAWRRGLGAVAMLGLASVPGLARADFVNEQTGDAGLAPFYRALVFGGIDTAAATDPGYFAADMLDGVDYTSNVAAKGLALGGGTVTTNGATLSGTAWSVNSGFMASRNFASISVSNANTTDDYYLVAGQGGTTRVQFSNASGAASASFSWHVSGAASGSPLAEARSRIDVMAAAAGSRSWFDLFSEPTALKAFGPGTYTYTVDAADFSQAIDLFFWTSAYAKFGHDSVPQGFSGSATADFGSTYVLEAVTLFDAQGDTLDGWTMTDLGTQQAVFDAGGRLAAVAAAPTLPAAVPEPGTYALMLAGLGLVGLVARRRRPA